MGGQTALNTAVALAETGMLDLFGVEFIGAKPEAIYKAEDRELFKDAMLNIGLKCRGGFVEKRRMPACGCWTSASLRSSVRRSRSAEQAAVLPTT